MINFRYFRLSIPCFFAIVGALSLPSCDTNDGEPVFLGQDYFGHTLGNYKIYQVDSTFYDDFLGEIFEYSYQVKEVNQEFFTDSQGRETLRLERFYRLDDTKSWQIKNVWSSVLEKSRALKTEENITYLKLVFPIKRNATWNGNLFNNKPNQSYRITALHEQYTLKDITFDSTITVLQRDFSTLIGEDFQYEIYAKGVGMIKKKFVSLDKEIDGTIIRGVDYTYSLIEYGFNE